MKKLTFLALAALTAGMTLSSCGTTKDDDESDNSKSKDYKEIVEDYFDSFKGSDCEELLKRVYPDNLAEMTYKYGDFDYLKEYLDKDVELISVEKGDDLSKEDITNLATYLGKMKYPLDLLDEYGIENMHGEHLEEMKKKYSEFNWDEYQSPYDIDEAYLVKVQYKYDDVEKDGEMLVYHIDNEGWKIAEDLWRYIVKSNKSSLDAAASSLYKAYDAASYDIDSNLEDMSGTYIISSDISKNSNLTNQLNTDTLNDYVNKYFPETKKYDYFVVFDNGAPAFVAVARISDHKWCGTYPGACIPSQDGEHISEHINVQPYGNKNYDFDELYELAAELVK